MIILPERAGIQQHGKSFTGSKFAFCMLSSDTLLASSSLCLSLDFVETLLEARQRESADGRTALNKRKETPGYAQHSETQKTTTFFVDFRALQRRRRRTRCPILQRRSSQRSRSTTGQSSNTRRCCHTMPAVPVASAVHNNGQHSSGIACDSVSESGAAEAV